MNLANFLDNGLLTLFRWSVQQASVLSLDDVAFRSTLHFKMKDSTTISCFWTTIVASETYFSLTYILSGPLSVIQKEIDWENRRIWILNDLARRLGELFRSRR